MSDSVRKTVLHDLHIESGARMAPFGGFLMPIQYEGIIKEHMAARQGAALFDTCHMGEFRLRGITALQDLERLVSCDVGTIPDGGCRYGMLCNETGGVIDDLLVYRFSHEDFMLVVNAGTQGNDFEWISQHLSPGTRAEDISAQTAKVDLQGPMAPGIMEAIMDHSIADLRFYRFMTTSYEGEEVIVSRTGYTGEIGFEFYGSAEKAVAFWRAAMRHGAVPAGLGARDTLRLEMGMPLYGHELSQERNAAEAGFTRALSTDKDFIGSKIINEPGTRTATLIGIQLEGRRAAREGAAVQDTEGNNIGAVTSGSMAPSLGCAVALAYVEPWAAKADTPVQIDAGRALLKGKIVSLPFYREATGRRTMKDFLQTALPPVQQEHKNDTSR